MVAFWKSIFFLARILPTSFWVLSFLGKHNAPTNIWVSRMLIIESAEIVGVLALPDVQGHPRDLFLTISVLQRKFCWLGTEVSAVLLGSKVLNLRSRIYQMYQKFLLEVFYPSNLLEIFFVRELCARHGVAR